MKNISIGVDIENIDKFAKLDFKKDRFFFDHIYTEKEMKYCLSKKNSIPHIAARFAGKEAVIKVIGGFGGKISPRDIEILNSPRGAPAVKINNKKFANINITISLSHCRDKAIAFALGVKNG